jgi:hypothetical protein
LETFGDRRDGRALPRFAGLRRRNKRCSPAASGRGAAGRPLPPADSQIALPFIVVNTKKETVVDCEMAEDKQEIFFNFSAPFEIHDDSETLKRMHMQRCASDQLTALVPPNLVQFARDSSLVTDPPAAAAAGRGANGRR